ncbi:PREDICTED: 23 kDa jasmonate-induced protein-like [Prunus mume]|uniref:23 kDa jasmonate-induced protein-like n=1 Tax=Prunus mume TaxID=102107 RepID=A0ABM0NZW6_PRUMU|nr:PREDICTED: 23 kDa jasmonate-induced protein-like [Prunus mume]
MAYNLLCNPNESSTFKGMSEFECQAIERKDKEKVALQMKNIGEKDLKALTFVENFKKHHGDGISTLCLVYNATGDTGAFLHVQSVGKASASNVVYNGKAKDGEDREWMLTWSNNRFPVHTENRPAEHYVSNVGWIPIIYDGLN